MPGQTSRPPSLPSALFSRGAACLRGAPTPCSGLWEHRAGPPGRGCLSWSLAAVLGFAAGHRRGLPSGAPIIPSPIVFWGQGWGHTWVPSTSPSSPGGQWQSGHFCPLNIMSILPLPTLPPCSPSPPSRPPTPSLSSADGPSLEMGVLEAAQKVGLRGVGGRGYPPATGHT